jgi:hypothetical protein
MSIQLNGDGSVIGLGAQSPGTGIPLSVNQGGSGRSTLTTNAILLGNGTGVVQFVSPGSIGNVLKSDGTTWVSGPPTSVLPNTGSIGNVLTSTGTTWVSQALPSQLPSPTSTGQVLTANGTEWVSEAPQSRPGFINAWVVFNGTNGAIINSYNVTSVVRTANGKYTINIASGAFSNGNYCISGILSDNDHVLNWVSSTATQLLVTTSDAHADSNNAFSNTQRVNVMMLG